MPVKVNPKKNLAIWITQMTKKIPIYIHGKLIEVSDSDTTESEIVSDWESDNDSNPSLVNSSVASELLGRAYKNISEDSDSDYPSEVEVPGVEINSESEQDSVLLISESDQNTDTGDESEIVPQISSALLSRLDEINKSQTLETKVFVKERKDKIKKSKFLTKTSKFLVHSKEQSEPVIDINEFKKEWEEHDKKLEVDIDLSTTEVLKVDKKKKKKFVQNLYEEIQSLRNFIIEEIAPLELAVPNALLEAKQELEAYLDLDISQITKSYDSAISDAIKIKVLDFIFGKLKLTKSQKKDLIIKHLKLSPEDYIKYRDNI